MEYEYDIALPSIERSDSPPQANSSTNTGTYLPDRFNRQNLATAANTPLPLSSPVKTPRKTPNLQRNGSSPGQSLPSPARVPSITSSPLNPDRRSSTPLLQSRRSTASLKRGDTPLRQMSSRQSSYNFPSALPGAIMQPPNGMQDQTVEEKPAITAASVARDYFQKEMGLQDSADCDPKTIMLIHDSCYGHRYSRPRTSKSLLGTIVERPERIHASILGLSTAYVRMGGRHAGGLAPPYPDRDSRLGAAVPFKIRKTSRSVPLNSAAATHVHGQKWMEELQIMCDSAQGKLALNGKELVRPIGYGKDENGTSLPKLHEGDLYLCSESLNALEGCLGGVCDAVDVVFSPENTRRAFVCIRPPGHHCSSNYPSGFCWINNVHVGITHAAISHGLTHAAIIDFDLHHGDGSQTIAWEHNRKALNLPKNAAPHKKTPIGYFSLHDIHSYPCEMGDEEKVRNASLCIENAHGQSIWNVHLEPWKTHADFWRLYNTKYAVLIDKARNFLRCHAEKLSNIIAGVKPKAAIFLSAGFDASEWEGEGMQRHKVNVPTDFYARFTADVVRMAEEEGLGVEGRVISVLEGGYSNRALTSGVLGHVCGLAQHSGSANTSEPVPTDGLSAEMRMKLGMLKMHDSAAIGDRSRSENGSQFDAEWWNVASLESLETLVNPTVTQPTATKPKNKTSGNYSSPTHASTAKMTDHARVRRSLSGQLERMILNEPEPIPPPPEVDWATAAYELSRVLIPADRQTLSCTYDELNTEATRAKRERQSTIGLPTNGEQRMQLRDRKAKPSYDEEATKPPNRRKTIAAVGDLPDPNLGQADDLVSANDTSRPRRRSSGASSVLAGFQNMQISDPTSRSSSVMSEKPRKAVIVKKPRTATAPRAPPAKPKTSPNKATGTAPPIPRLSSTLIKQQATGAHIGPSASEVVTDELQSSQARSGEVQELSTVEDLSSGVKKMSIKLKVPSPEVNAEREKKAAEAKVRKPRLKKSAEPKAPKPAAVGTNKTPMATFKPAVRRGNSNSVYSTAPSRIAEVPTSDLSAITPFSMEQGNADEDLSLSNQSPVFLEQGAESSQDIRGLQDLGTPMVENSRPEAAQEDPAASVDTIPTSETVVYQRVSEDKPETSVATATHATSSVDNEKSGPSNQASPPADATTVTDTVGGDSTKHAETASPATPGSAKRTKADLPVFTSNSPIPFGRPVLSNLNDNLQTSPAQDVSHKITAETPDQAITILEEAAKPGLAVTDSQWKTWSDASEASGPSRASEASIWDVPETPQR